MALGPYYQHDAGVVPYDRALALQKRLVEARKTGRLDADIVIWLEHPPVFTLGLRGGLENLLVTAAFLRDRGVSVVATRRGGNITYHGPGQLVAYPIVHLGKAGMDVPGYVTLLETVMLRVAAEYGVVAERSSLNRGIFKQQRKLGSVGIAVRGGITYHGFALNAALDLGPFDWINPCGLTGIRMASIASISGSLLDMQAVRRTAMRHFAEAFGGSPVDLSWNELQKRIE